jgi:hypothetical protein
MESKLLELEKPPKVSKPYTLNLQVFMESKLLELEKLPKVSKPYTLNPKP